MPGAAKTFKFNVENNVSADVIGIVAAEKAIAPFGTFGNFGTFGPSQTSRWEGIMSGEVAGVRKISVSEDSYWKMQEMKVKLRCATWNELVDRLWRDQMTPSHPPSSDRWAEKRLPLASEALKGKR